MPHLPVAPKAIALAFGGLMLCCAVTLPGCGGTSQPAPDEAAVNNPPKPPVPVAKAARRSGSRLTPKSIKDRS